MTISELAYKIRREEKNEKNKRLTDIIEIFEKDFKEVIYDLIKCDVKYQPCFWYKCENDGEFHIYPPETKLDLTLNGCSGGKSISDSILFTFQHNEQERKKRLFYIENKGWYYVARNGSLLNDSFYLKDYRKDLILYLDGYFEGEYK